MNTPSHARLFSLLGLQQFRTGAAQLNDGTLVSIHETIDEDWNYYSKAWHRAHGPKRTVTRRWVQLDKNGKSKQYEVDAFRGNYLLHVLVQHYKMQKVKVGRELQPAQLYAFARVELIRRIGGVSIYQRTLRRTLLDYVVVAAGATFHAATPQAAIAGWKKKECARIHFENEVLTYETARERYGFCHEGITEFCDLNEVDITGQYSRTELSRIVAARQLTNCRLFAKELQRIGIAISC